MKDSMLEQEEKNHKLYMIIAIAGAIVLHGVVIAVSANRFGLAHAHPILWALPVVFVAWLVVSIVAVLKDADWATEAPWPYWLLIVLAAISALSIGYCPTC